MLTRQPAAGLAFLCAGAFLLASCNSRGSTSLPPPPPFGHSAVKPPPPDEAAETETRVEMVNVNIHLDRVLILHIRHLSGKLLSAKNGRPPNFDDKLSYIIAVESAEISVTASGMTHMMNTYVFGEADAPLKNLRLSIQGGQVKQE